MTSTHSDPSPFPEASFDEWRHRVETELGDGRTFGDTLITRTLEGLSIEPLYVADPDRRDAAAAPEAGGWAIAQRVAHPSPTASNRRALEDLENGGSGLAVELGRAPRGLAPIEEAPVGDAPGGDDRGVDVEWLHDLDALTAGVFLDAIPITFSSSANGLPLAATFVALCRERGVDPASVRAHFGMDPIASLARDGELPGDLTDARSELCRLAAHSRLRYDNARALCVDAGVWHRAGGHAALELGYAAAAFVEMLRWLESSGLPPAAAHPEFVWRFDVGQDIVTEIAKLRAARELHAKILGSAGVREATPLVLHVTTSPRCLTRLDPWTNLLRLSHATMSAALGGADLVTTLPFDLFAAQAGHDTSDLGRRCARNTQLVLERESRLDHVGDPTRGAYAVEQRTAELGRAAWDVMRGLEREGGLTAALTGGRIAEEIAASRADLESSIAGRERRILGVSDFRASEDARRPPAGDPIDRTAEREARAARIAARGTVALGSIDDLDHAAEAAAGGATLEEIGGALVRGVPVTLPALAEVREDEIFERRAAGSSATEEVKA